ncbi:MAG TPA: alpha/beta fold hydrolase [Burkholderiaceae bacterium]
MLAHTQRWGLLFFALAVGGWLAWAWPRAPGLALAGAALALCSHALVLALQCALMWRQNRADPAPHAPLRTVLAAWWAECRIAPQVYAWRQPFRSQAVPDLLVGGAGAPRRGVVLVHGFICNRGFWNPWLRALRARGQVCVAVNLEPPFTAIDDYVAVVDAAVRRVTDATGLPPVLLCHSMGGLVARAWLRAAGDDARVHRVMTLGTPHQGTWIARFSHMPNGVQMRRQSPWLRELQAHESPGRKARFVCWYSNCDNIVFPTSTAMLPGADNRFAPGLAHVQMAFDQRVMRACLELLALD